LNAIRTYHLKYPAGEEKSATFNIVFRNAPPYTEAEFKNGAEELRAMVPAIGTIKPDFPFPDQGLTHLVRQAMLHCSKLTKDCQLVINSTPHFNFSVLDMVLREGQ
jgi:hypothetical protein